MRHLTLLLLTTCLLCACGQKGNLTLPDDRDVVRPAAPAATAPAAATDGNTTEERERANGTRNTRSN